MYDQNVWIDFKGVPYTNTTTHTGVVSKYNQQHYCYVVLTRKEYDDTVKSMKNGKTVGVDNIEIGVRCDVRILAQGLEKRKGVGESSDMYFHNTV